MNRFAAEFPDDWAERLEVWEEVESREPWTLDPPLVEPESYPCEVPCAKCQFPLYKAHPGMVCPMCGKTVTAGD